MTDLPTGMPFRISRLPKDNRRFPVPWFVQWFDEIGSPCSPGIGKPDFRVIDPGKFVSAVKKHRCWVCGEPLGRHQIFVIGPMCVVNRVTSEPPCHRECAEYSVKACPFLTRPRMRRNDKDLPEGGVVAGYHIDRNPGASCLYETSKYQLFNPYIGGRGYLFSLGDPDRVDWWANGKIASRDEVMQSIDSGYPILEDMARKEGAKALEELQFCRERAMELLPA